MEERHLGNINQINKTKDDDGISEPTTMPIIPPKLVEEQRALTADEMAHKGK